MDDYGMDSAWELGFAERAGKRIVGLSLDHHRLNSPNQLKAHTVWDYWMHGWHEHLRLNDLRKAANHLQSKTVYLSIPVRCTKEIELIGSVFQDYARRVYHPLSLLDAKFRESAKELWHAARHLCIEAIEASDVFVTYMDYYGMDSAWELGFAERAGKQIIGLSLDAEKLDQRRHLRAQTVWDYWMHGWKEHTVVQGLEMLENLLNCAQDFKVPVICPIIERYENGSLEILVQERAKDSDMRYYGVIEIPGGKIRRAETITEALKREVREECGLNVQPLGTNLALEYELHESKAKLFEPFAVSEELGDHSFIGIFAVCEVVSGELRQTAEGRNQRWVSLGELENLLSTKEILPVIAPGLAKYLKSMRESVR
jgi:mutator protein MutT